jgi:hypothetical protein
MFRSFTPFTRFMVQFADPYQTRLDLWTTNTEPFHRVGWLHHKSLLVRRTQREIRQRPEPHACGLSEAQLSEARGDLETQLPEPVS